MTPTNQWLSRSRRGAVTFGIRLMLFAVSLSIIGAFFLPWVKIDGVQQAHSGVGLTALFVSPMVNYLFVIAPIQTGVLLGCPPVMFVFAAAIASKYAQRKTAIISTVVVLASAIAIIFGTRGLLATDQPVAHIGLSLISVLCAVLLVHQGLIKLRTKLEQRQRFPSVHRTLSIITGSGYYRWRET